MEAQAKRTQGGPSGAIIQERKRMLITRGEGRIFPGNEKSKAKHREILTKKKKKNQCFKNTPPCFQGVLETWGRESLLWCEEHWARNGSFRFGLTYISDTLTLFPHL